MYTRHTYFSILVHHILYIYMSETDYIYICQRHTHPTTHIPGSCSYSSYMPQMCNMASVCVVLCLSVSFIVFFNRIFSNGRKQSRVSSFNFVPSISTSQCIRVLQHGWSKSRTSTTTSTLQLWCVCCFRCSRRVYCITLRHPRAMNSFSRSEMSCVVISVRTPYLCAHSSRK